MQTMNAKLDNGPFTDIHYLLFNLFFCFFNHLFNSCRVNTPVSYQSLQTQTGDLTTEWIKRRKNNCFRGIIYDKINAGSCFNGADISSLATNDLAFYFITFKVKDGDRVFNCLLGCGTLDCLNDD